MRMRVKKLKLLLASLLVLVMLAVAGCSGISPKDYMISALTKPPLKSFNFFGETSLSVTASEEMLEAEPALATATSFLNNTVLSYTGAYKEELKKIEMTLDLDLKGDIGISLSIPMVISEESIAVKIPDSPIIESFLPSTLLGQFITIDLTGEDELTSELFSGISGGNIPEIDTSKLLKALLNDFDEKEFFTLVDKKDLGASSDVDIDQAAKISFTNDNLKSGLTTLLDKSLPSAIDIVKKDKSYKEMFSFTDEQIADFEKSLKEEKAELKKTFNDEIGKFLDIKNFDILIGANKNKDLTFSKFLFNIDFNDPENKQSINIDCSSQMSITNLNKKIDFKIEVPEDAMTIEDAIALYTSEMFGDLYGDYDEEDLDL